MCRSDCLCTRSRLCLNHVLCYCDVLEMNDMSLVTCCCHVQDRLSLSKEKTLNQPRTLLCVLFVEHRCKIHFPCQVCSSVFIVKIIQVQSRFPIVRHLHRDTYTITVSTKIRTGLSCSSRVVLKANVFATSSVRWRMCHISYHV
jgi:hypothetical protein